MVDLSRYIHELLHSHECVAVPGLGGFIIRKKTAVVYMAQNLFAPPARHLHFNAQLTHNDGLLAHHISKKTGTSYEKALENIDETVNDILYQLYKGQSVVFNDIGTISNMNGFLKFEPDFEQNIQDENYGLNSFIIHTLQSGKRRIPHPTLSKGERVVIKSYQIAAVIAFLLLSIGGYFLQTEPVQYYMKSSLCPQVSLVVKDFLPSQSPPEVSHPSLPEAASTNLPKEEAIAPSSTPETTPSEIATAPIVVAHVSDDNFMQTPVLGQYYIIIGAFRQPELAENLCKQMKATGYPATAILDIPSSTLRRVALQSFDNLASARESLREVKQTQEDAWVLKWKN